jgi:hypothetical protein
MGEGGGIVLRTVVFETAAQQSVDGCTRAFKRGQEICDAMVDLISRLPALGERLRGTNPPEFVIRSDDPSSLDVPVVTMHYRWEADDSITLIKVRYHHA